MSEAANPRLVVCDDSPTIRSTIVALLGKGYTFLVAASASEVLEKVVAFEPDLIISDLLMPVMDGYELCRRIRGMPSLRGVPVILLTAKTDDEARATGLEIGADDYLFKPVRPRELKARVNSLVQLRRTSRALEKSRREVRDILDNIQQAVFTVGRDLRVRPEHSRFVERIFGSEPFVDRKFSDLMAPGEDGVKTRQRLDDWLSLVFSDTQVEWPVLSQLVDKDIGYRRPKDGALRDLVLEFHPIRDETSQLISLMIVAEDVTDTRALQRTLEQRTRENEDNIEQISEFIRMDPEIFENFLNEADRTLKQSHRAAEALGDPQLRGAVVSELFRGMHALKANARSFRLNLIAAKAHWVEDTFAKLRADSKVSDEVIRETITRLNDLDHLLHRARGLAMRVLHPRTSRAGRDDANVPMLAVSRSHVNQMRQLARELRRSFDAALVEKLDAGLNALCMVPLVDAATRLEHTATQTAVSLGKEKPEINFIGGEGVLVDFSFVETLHPVLVQLLSNAIDHGLESTDERLAVDKQGHGRIDLTFWVEDGKLSLSLRDDGRGLDVVALINRAVESGHLSAELAATLTEADAHRLIFLPGLSTARAVTEVSGRGVGMDMVNATVQKLGGYITVESVAGKGTAFTIVVPKDVADGRRSSELFDVFVAAGEPSGRPVSMTSRFFGQYLLERGLVSAEQLLEAIKYQTVRNLPLAQFALITGVVRMQQIELLGLNSARTDQEFGELAVERGVLSREQLAEVLVQHDRSHLYIGDALVLLGALTEETLSRELSQYRAELEASSLGAPRVAPGLPFGQQVGELVELTARYLHRTAGLIAKVDEVTVGGRVLPQALLEVGIGLKGSIEGEYVLRMPRALTEKLTEGMLGFEVQADAELADAAAEFANLVAGNFCAKLAVDGLRVEITPPRIELEVAAREVPDGTMVAVYPVHTQEGLMHILFMMAAK